MSLFLKTLIKISNQQILLPFYHLVTDENPKYIKSLYSPKNVIQFKAELNVLLKYFQPISLEELFAIKKGQKKITKPYFHLTFDDGLSNFHEIIAPILIEKKIPATVFLNTDFIDNKALFYRFKASLLIDNFINANEKIKKIYLDFIFQKNGEKKKEKREERRDSNFVNSFLLGVNYQNKELLDELANKINYSFTDFLIKEKPYLSLSQIKELQQEEFTFGAHSTNHPFYADLTLNEQIKQTTDSLNWLQNNLTLKHKVFSFPFNDVGISKGFFTKIKPFLDLSFGTSGIKKDSINFNLHRLDMEKSSVNTKQFLIKQYLKFFLKMPLGKNTVKRN